MGLSLENWKLDLRRQDSITSASSSFPSTWLWMVEGKDFGSLCQCADQPFQMDSYEWNHYNGQAFQDNFGNCIQRRNRITMLVLQAFFLLLQIPWAEFQTHAIKCPIREPLHTPQKYYRRGDFMIGASMSQVILFLDDEFSFQEYPTSNSGSPM